MRLMPVKPCTHAAVAHTVALTPMAPIWLLMPRSLVLAARSRTSSFAIILAASCTCTPVLHEARPFPTQPCKRVRRRVRERTMFPRFASFLISACTRRSSRSS